MNSVQYESARAPFARNIASRVTGSRKGAQKPGWRRIWVVLGLGVLLACAPALCTESRGVGPEEGVLRATLENGLRVVVVRNNLAPVVTTTVNYLVGSNEAPEGFPGMAHAQEHMMFRGSPGLSADQLADIVASMGGMFNADTQQTVTQYFLTVPAEDLDIALHIEAIRMQGVLDSEKLWDQERGAIEQEVAQDLSDPEYVFYTQLLTSLFKGTPYAHTPLGTRPSFDRTTGAMLKKFHETWYVPNNAILVIVGDVQPDKALYEVKRFFAEIPAKRIPERPKVSLEPVQAETLRLKTDQPYGLATISFRMPGYDSSDYSPCQVLAEMLNSQRSDLFELVVEGKALYAGFTLEVLPQAGLGYAIGAFPKGGEGSVLVQEIRKILGERVKNGFPAELVEAAKRSQVTKAELGKNSISGLAMAWSNALAVEGRRSPEEDVDSIKRVSVDDVNRAARKYFDLDHAIVGILTPEASGKPTPSRAHEGAESFTPQETRKVRLPDWGEKALKRLSIPTSTVKPEVFVFQNGLLLIVQPASVSDMVCLYGHIRNKPDLQVPSGKEGLNQVLDQLFSYGTSTLDRLAFQKALDDIGASESAGTDFSVQVLADHFERGVQLLADNELHPALPEGAFKTIRKQVAATVAGQLQSPDYLANRALDVGLFPLNDPMRREATPSTISSLTIRDVKDYHQRVFRPDLTTIVVIGKITPERAKAAIGKYFGSWEATGPKPEVLLPPVPPNKPSRTDVPDNSRVQDIVTLAETLELNRSDPDYYALELGNHVLGGAFYATRLYHDLREETGLVYHVSSVFDIGKTRSLYLVNYACDPDKVAKAQAIIERNLKKMQSTPVGPEELRQAKVLLLREVPLSESSIDSIAQGLIFRATNDLPLDEPIRASHHYLRLTAEQVRAAFAKWLRPDDFVQVTKGPLPK